MPKTVYTIGVMLTALPTVQATMIPAGLENGFKLAPVEKAGMEGYSGRK